MSREGGRTFYLFINININGGKNSHLVQLDKYETALNFIQ
jgi:hypothetical protein